MAPNVSPDDAAGIAGAGAVAITAARDLRSGEALRLNYGDMKTDQLLLNYGFVAGTEIELAGTTIST